MTPAQLDASAFEPYFGSNLNATVSSALLSANGDASFSGEGRALKAGYKGDVSLSNVRLIDRVNSDQLAGWKLLGLTKLNARYDERGADVEAARITFANFYGRVLLDAQGKLNLTRYRGARTRERAPRKPRPSRPLQSLLPSPLRLTLPPARPTRRKPRRHWRICASASSCCKTAA